MPQRIPAFFLARMRLAERDGTPLDAGVFDRAAKELFWDAEGDPATLPSSATFAWIATPKRLGSLAALTRVRFAHATGLKATQLPMLATLPNLEGLCLLLCTLPSLEPLAGLASLRHLVIRDPRRLESLAGLERLRNLETLDIVGAPKLRSLAPLAARRPRLRGLRLQGGWNSTLGVDDLEPLRAQRALEFLELWIAARDPSLRPIHGLPKLRHLELNSRFPLEEIAALRAAYPSIRSARLQPYVEVPPVLCCRRCGGPVVSLTGHRQRANLCPRCDAAKLAEGVERFEALVAQFSRRRRLAR